MTDKTFPPVVQWELPSHSPGYIEPGEWFAYQYPIVKRYFQKILDGWQMGDFLLKLGCRRVVLYAITDLADFAARDLMRFAPEVQLEYFACNNASQHPDGHLGRAVYGIEKLTADYRAGKIDKIVVCNIFHGNEIFEELLSAGIHLEDLIAINAILYQT